LNFYSETEESYENFGKDRKIGNWSFEKEAELKYLETTLTVQNCMQEEVKCKLNLGNACYHSVQSLLSSRLLSRNIKLKLYKNHNSASCFVWV
jgi:hypothetical protein